MTPDLSKTPLEYLAEQNEKVKQYEALIKELGEALRFFVEQGGFPFGDFAECADVDLRKAVEGFDKAKEALSHIPEEVMK